LKRNEQSQNTEKNNENKQAIAKHRKNQKTKNQKLSVHSLPSFFVILILFFLFLFLFIFKRFLEVVVRNTFGFLFFWFLPAVSHM